jgi:hypothetical protein
MALTLAVARSASSIVTALERDGEWKRCEEFAPVDLIKFLAHSHVTLTATYLGFSRGFGIA